MRHAFAAAVWFAATTLTFVVPSASAQGTTDDYQRADALNRRYQGLAVDVAEPPRWIGETSRLWYRKSMRGGNVFTVVDAATRQKRPAFDHDKVAAALSTDSTRHTGTTLPFSVIEFVDRERAFTFNAGGSAWRCIVATSACAKTGPAAGNGRGRGGMPWVDEAPMPDEAPPAEELAIGAETMAAFAQQTRQARLSPDSTHEAFIAGHDLAIRPRGSSDTIRLSRDGTEKTPYAFNSILWSPDSRKIVAYKVTAGTQRRVYFVLSSPADQLQPKLDSTRPPSLYRKPGDEVDVREPVLFDVATRTATVIDRSLFPNPYAISRFAWYADSRGFTFEDNERGHQTYRVIEVDAASGQARAVITEQSSTFIYYNPSDSTLSSGKRFRADLADGREIIWMSERDGWNHLYLYDGATGRVKNQITKGPWVVRYVTHVDSARRQVYFAGNGRNAGEDPYLLHHYRVNFDGSDLVDLTPARGNHGLAWSAGRRFYVDTYSQIDAPPVSELRRASDRSLIMTLETPDLSALTAAGWRPPEVFVAKARDGVTDIWGVIYRPSNFDSTRKYAVIENIYAGPQGSFVPKTFSVNSGMRTLAELGFVVVQIDGMGTSNRSKAFHDVAAKNLADAGFTDRILWHRAVAARHAWYDTSRVGIYGTSAGGQNAMGALLFHPEFYKAAFSAAGCHDNRMDKIWWNEAWMGEFGPHYGATSNVTHAKNLKGHLLLTVGEMDTNVDPSSTLQVANALLLAGKDFDLMVVPNGGHGATGPEGTRRRNDFFVRWLWGKNPPDWNSGITLNVPGTNATQQLQFPAEEPPPRGFFEEDPKLMYPMWWF
jgi:dipeptidyl aminopeptidase/acylaminoacyl peptidase